MAAHVAEYLGGVYGERASGGSPAVLKDMVAAGYAGMGKLYRSLP